MWRVQYCMCVCLVLHVNSDWWYMRLFKVTRVFSATGPVSLLLYLCLFIGSCEVCAVLCMCLCLCGVWRGTCVSVECQMWSVLRVTHQVLSLMRLVLHVCLCCAVCGFVCCYMSRACIVTCQSVQCFIYAQFHSAHWYKHASYAGRKGSVPCWAIRPLTNPVVSGWLNDRRPRCARRKETDTDYRIPHDNVYVLPVVLVETISAILPNVRTSSSTSSTFSSVRANVSSTTALQIIPAQMKKTLAWEITFEINSQRAVLLHQLNRKRAQAQITYWSKFPCPVGSMSSFGKLELEAQTHEGAGHEL